MDNVTRASRDDEVLESIIEAYATETASDSSTDPGDLFENLDEQPTLRYPQGRTTGEKPKVLGKRIDGERPQYLIQCWIYAKRGGAANHYLDRCLQKHDARVSQDLAEQGQL